MSDNFYPPQGDRHTIPTERRATYYIGLVLAIIGFLLFMSVFVSVAMMMNQPFGGMSGMPGEPDAGPGGIFLRAVVGMMMIIGGSVLKNIGSRGLAGSGVVLDPQQARRDLEPWARMAGGVAKDALEETGLKRPEAPGLPGADLPFDEKLRRLEQLRAQGLLSEGEYRAKRAQILGEKW